MLHFHVPSKYCKLNKITINSFQVFKNVCFYKDLVWHHGFTPSFISPPLLIDTSSSLLHSQPESRVPQALLCSLFIFKGQIYLFLLFIGILSKYAHCLILISKVSLWEDARNVESNLKSGRFTMSKKFEDGTYSSLWKPDSVNRKEIYLLFIDWSLI